MRHVLNGPWAIQDADLRRLAAAAQRFHSDPKAFGFFFDDDPEEAESNVTSDGTAVLPVVGPLFRRSDRFSKRFGEATYDLLLEDVNTALSNPEVERIVLDIDSPGGDALGLSELANRIYEGRQEKEIVAVIRALGASAAYWIASSADRIFIAPEGIAGSIGSVMRILDFSRMMEMDGVEEIEIVSAQSPKKRPDPKTDSGRLQLQQEVNAVAQVFVNAVAKNRGVSVDHVLAEFGQGGVFVGEAAVVAGLADGVATLDEVLAGTENQQTSRGLRGDQEEPMNRVRTDEINASWLAEHLPEVAESLRAEGRSEGADALEAARTEAREAGTTAERERVEGIRAALEGTGQEGLFEELVADSEATAVTAHERITAAVRETRAASDAAAAARIAAREDDEGDLPEVTPSNGDDPTAENDSARRVANVVSMAQRMGIAPKEEAR